MKKQILALVFAISLFSLTSNFAQAQAPQTSAPAQAGQQQVVIIKPNFIAEDVAYVLNSLNTIEIKGEEVDAFLNVKNLLTTAVQAAIKEKKKNEDIITIEMSVQQGQAIVNLMQRVKLTGANAEKHKRAIDAIVKAAKDVAGTK